MTTRRSQTPRYSSSGESFVSQRRPTSPYPDYSTMNRRGRCSLYVNGALREANRIERADIRCIAASLPQSELYQQWTSKNNFSVITDCDIALVVAVEAFLFRRNLKKDSPSAKVKNCKEFWLALPPEWQNGIFTIAAEKIIGWSKVGGTRKRRTKSKKSRKYY